MRTYVREQELVNIATEKVKSFNLNELVELGFLPKEIEYFPSIYYPPITMYPSSNEEEAFKGLQYNQDDPLSLYIHIPFCPTHCVFCHWATSINDQVNDMEQYVKMLGKEMDLWKKRLGVTNPSPQSILIGGGTPTMLPHAQMEEFLKILHSKFELKKGLQISCEVEPGTILGSEGLEKLKVMKLNGINRISIGIQSFNDQILKSIGRAHNAQEAEEAIDQVRKVNFDSLSIDLIYGFPEQTTDVWIDTLKKAFSLDIDSCQIYRLRIVPHGDKVGKIKNNFDNNPQKFVKPSQIFLWKELGILYAERNGYYEDSRRVFSKNTKHSSEYLKDHTDRLLNVWGIGMSSWSNIQGRLFLNCSNSYEEYYSYIKDGKLPINRGKVRSDDDQKRWALVLPLKHLGLSKKQYEENTGKSVHEVFGEKIKKLKKYKLIEENRNMICLSEKGRFFADEVVIQFYHPNFIPFPKTAYIDGVLSPYKP